MYNIPLGVWLRDLQTGIRRDRTSSCVILSDVFEHAARDFRTVEILWLALIRRHEYVSRFESDLTQDIRCGLEGEFTIKV